VANASANRARNDPGENQRGRDRADAGGNLGQAVGRLRPRWKPAVRGVHGQRIGRPLGAPIKIRLAKRAARVALISTGTWASAQSAARTRRPTCSGPCSPSDRPGSRRREQHIEAAAGQPVLGVAELQLRHDRNSRSPSTALSQKLSAMKSINSTVMHHAAANGQRGLSGLSWCACARALLSRGTTPGHDVGGPTRRRRLGRT